MLDVVGVTEAVVDEDSLISEQTSNDDFLENGGGEWTFPEVVGE